MIVLVKDKADCCACGACLEACPKQAISMEMDAYGCNYPQIDAARCVECGKCLQVCGYQRDVQGKEPQLAFAAMGKNEKTVSKSASGGIFATLAKCCAHDGYEVAGAIMECAGNTADVYHILSGADSDIARMQGSKYVQSEAWRCYGDVLRVLKSGKKVLFSGTPCQVMAVKQLSGDPENLVTIDLICHGVPSLKMLNDYLKVLGRYFRGSIDGFSFRDKSLNKEFCARIEIAKREKYYFLRHHDLSFYKLFLEGTIYRENCYSCPYAKEQRISDLTIGDYWGVEKYHRKAMETGIIPQRKDWSCILVNSQKGREFLEEYKDALFLVPTELEWIIAHNRQLSAPSKMPQKRAHLLERYVKSGYDAVEEMFVKENGGKLRFFLRLVRNIYRNRRISKASEKEAL